MQTRQSCVEYDPTPFIDYLFTDFTEKSEESGIRRKVRFEGHVKFPVRSVSYNEGGNEFK